MILRWIAGLGLLFGNTASLLAADAQTDGAPSSANPVQLSGSVRTGFWSSSRDLDDDSNLLNGSIWLQAVQKISEDNLLYAEGYVSKQDMLDRRTGDAKNDKNVLREVYWDNSLGAVNTRIGKQIIVWGRADRFNPTDNLTPRDFTLLTPDDDDQRIGLPGVKTAYHAGTASITGIWFWDFQPNTIPLASGSPEVTFHSVPVEHPYRQGAVKIEQSGETIDWSLSYYAGFDLNPDLALSTESLPAQVIDLHYHRVRIFGADMATTTGRYGWRAEAAYTKTEDPDGHDPFIKNPFLYTVLGVERIFRETLSVNVQYLARVVTHYQGSDTIADPVLRQIAQTQAIINNQADRYGHSLALRISEKWFYQTLETEMATVYSFNKDDYALRLKANYALNDRWKITVGGDLFRGDPDSFYGRLRDNSTFYVQLKFSF